MNIIGKITEEIKKCIVKHNRKPHLILLGRKEQDELFVAMRMRLLIRFRGVRIKYTKAPSELQSLIY